MNVVLASASPRRKQILENAGYGVTVRASDADETLPENITPEKAVEHLARVKAHAVERNEGEIIIAADTVVVLDGKILGKPADEDGAFEMLSLLSGRKQHTLLRPVISLTWSRTVRFTDLTES